MKRLPLAALAALTATPALAHVGPGAHGAQGSFAAGLTHPILGLDHALAMVAVGLWAATLGGRALAAVPAAFVGTMVAGFVLALAGVGLPFVEPAILASIVVLGLAVAFAVRLPALAGAGVVAAFAVFHGYAHGTELGGAGVAGYLAGFAVATAGLHAAGIGLARLMAAPRVARALGGVTAALGLGLATGAV